MLACMECADDNQLLLAHQVHSLLEIVVSTNRKLMRDHVVPPIYESGVVWRLEPWKDKVQHFANCIEANERRWVCCKAACCWRLAELREADPQREHLYGLNLQWDLVKGGTGTGRQLHDLIRSNPGDKLYLHHVQITKPDDGWEDPSRLLQQ